MFWLLPFFGQNANKVAKATKKFNNLEYAGAIKNYDNLVNKGYTLEEVFKNLGDSHYFNADYVASAYCYSRLFELSNTTADPEYMYRYAQALKSSKEYEKSDEWMEKFAKAKSNDHRAMKFMANRDYLSTIKSRKANYDVKPLSINSSASDFAPSFKGDMLYFSTARDTGSVVKSVNLWNAKPFLNIYKAARDASGEFTNAERLSKSVNKKTHESSTAFTKDGKTIYFTRNNSNNGKFSRDDQGVSRLKLYRATLEDGKWQNIEELPFNDDDFSVAHPTLSLDEQWLYFASDMPGTVGSSDIFRVQIHPDGTFGTPENLGDHINTEARETFPFIASDNTLYFASDGHPGLGGLDVFATKLSDNTKIVNLGSPLNGEQDDFSFVLIPDSNEGFFASNREGGQGSDDIYTFEQINPLSFECSSIVSGVAKDKNTGMPLSGTSISIAKASGETLGAVVTDEDGVFSVDGDCKEGSYTLKGSKEGYEEADIMIALEGEDLTDLVIALGQSKNPTVAIGTDLIKHLGLRPIYFDFDRSDIRPDAWETLEKIIAYLKANPEVNIEVHSHTDAVASDSYNDRLSQKRAVATVAYLVDHGIAKSRLNGTGYGEKRLVNDCDTVYKCRAAKHQLNRRSEFIVVE